MRRKNADDWPRERCLAFFWAQARILRAQRLGVALEPPRKRRATPIRAPRRTDLNGIQAQLSVCPDRREALYS